MADTFRALVTGSRDHEDKALIWGVLDWEHAEHPDMVVVHGACSSSQTRQISDPYAEGGAGRG